MQEEEGGREGKTEERREEGDKKTILTTNNTAIQMDYKGSTRHRVRMVQDAPWMVWGVLLRCEPRPAPAPDWEQGRPTHQHLDEEE